MFKYLSNFYGICFSGKVSLNQNSLTIHEGLKNVKRSFKFFLQLLDKSTSTLNFRLSP